MSQEKDKPDAGLRRLEHYKNRLPRWRHQLREHVLPFVRWETPYVAWLQKTMRTPALDTYFAVSANLGTHTFFMVVLPILFWCGYTSLGRGMVHILASGVFFSGFFKDMLCLPRPLSPPLQRITMSGSAALEYGFPSTHSTNAISVAVYSLFVLKYENPDVSPTTNSLLQVLCYCYGFSIVLGRLYCGMHGFLDVICGSLLGGALSVIQCVYGKAFDSFIHTESAKNLIIVILIILVLVRLHPEPVDDCPCFDDSVAFAAVMIGVEFATWHFARTTYAWSEPCLATVPFDLNSMGWVVVVLRIVLGVVMIFAWRGTMKPTLFRILPPIFRVIETLGLSLPRRFFKQASEYRKVPKQIHDDNIIPPVSQIPQMLTSLRRRRAVSIGPQSEADAYETMAYREKKRRDSVSSIHAVAPGSPVASKPEHVPRSAANGVASIKGCQSSLTSVTSPIAPAPPSTEPPDATDDTDLFRNLEKPRVRYDVEVVTKLIVYSGIGWLACEMCPILFEVSGLGSR